MGQKRCNTHKKRNKGADTSTQLGPSVAPLFPNLSRVGSLSLLLSFVCVKIQSFPFRWRGKELSQCLSPLLAWQLYRVITIKSFTFAVVKKLRALLPLKFRPSKIVSFFGLPPPPAGNGKRSGKFLALGGNK